MRFSLTPEEFASYSEYLRRKYFPKKYVSLGVVFGGTFVGAALLVGIRMLDIPFHAPSAIGAAVTTYLLLLYYSNRQHRKFAPLADGQILIERELFIDEYGVHDKRKNSESLTRWSAIISVERAPDQLYLFVDSIAAIIIPRSAFESDAAMTEFENTVRGYVQRNKNG